MKRFPPLDCLRWVLVSVALFALRAVAAEALVVPVWPGEPPGSEGRTESEKVRLSGTGEHIVASVHRPTLTVCLPEKPGTSRAAVLVIPGGGHRELWMDHEGYAIARALNERGVAAFILKYRLAREEGSTYSVEKHSLADVQRALRLIRSRAKEWTIDPAHLGVMGFSAGGELAALAGARGAPGNPTATDAVARESSVPAFQGLIYPGNTRAISPAKGAPPAFLLAGENDGSIAEELPNVHVRFRAVGVSSELHILAGVGHGFGIRAKNTGATAHWIDAFAEWMNAVLPR